MLSLRRFTLRVLNLSLGGLEPSYGLAMQPIEVHKGLGAYGV